MPITTAELFDVSVSGGQAFHAKLPVVLGQEVHRQFWNSRSGSAHRASATDSRSAAVQVFSRGRPRKACWRGVTRMAENAN